MKRMRPRGRRIISRLVVLCFPLCFLLAACGQGSVNPAVTWIEPASTTWPAWTQSGIQQIFSSHGQYIAAQALALAHSLYGPRYNSYYEDDPSLADVIAYWKRSCQKADGALCDQARSGNLQCVEFIAGVFATIDDELPYIGDANRFWDLYRGKVGWQEISAGAIHSTMPRMGDLVTWTGGAAGHLALVVDVHPPTHGQDGSITVVQSNSAHLLDRLTWHASGQIDSWPGYSLQGFIRQQEIAPCLQQDMTNNQQQWETLAIQAAVHYGTPARYFLRQLCQSDFQIDPPVSATSASAGGAHGVGITQVQANVAAHVPRCVINFVHNASNCDQMPGSLPLGQGIDPRKPDEAIPASAYIMSKLYNQYLEHYTKPTPQDDIQAYEMALAAYHEGSTMVDQAVRSCGTGRWLGCLEQQHGQSARDYIRAILGTVV